MIDLREAKPLHTIKVKPSAFKGNICSPNGSLISDGTMMISKASIVSQSRDHIARIAALAKSKPRNSRIQAESAEPALNAAWQQLSQDPYTDCEICGVFDTATQIGESAIARLSRKFVVLRTAWGAESLYLLMNGDAFRYLQSLTRFTGVRHLVDPIFRTRMIALQRFGRVVAGMMAERTCGQDSIIETRADAAMRMRGRVWSGPCGYCGYRGTITVHSGTVEEIDCFACRPGQFALTAALRRGMIKFAKGMAR